MWRQFAPELVTWCPLEPALQGALRLILSAANCPLLSSTQHILPPPLSTRIIQTQGQVSWPAGILVSQKVLQSLQHKAGRAAPHLTLQQPQPGPGNSDHGQSWPKSPRCSPRPSQAGQMAADGHLASLRFSQRQVWSNCTVSKQKKVCVSTNKAWAAGKRWAWQIKKNTKQNKTPTLKQKHISTGCKKPQKWKHQCRTTWLPGLPQALPGLPTPASDVAQGVEAGLARLQLKACTTLLSAVIIHLVAVLGSKSDLLCSDKNNIYESGADPVSSGPAAPWAAAWGGAGLPHLSTWTPGTSKIHSAPTLCAPEHPLVHT